MAYYLTYIQTFNLAAYLTYILALFYQTYILAFYLAFFLAFYLAFFLEFYRAFFFDIYPGNLSGILLGIPSLSWWLRSSGATGVGSWQLRPSGVRSRGARWDRELVVEAYRGPLGSGAGS